MKEGKNLISLNVKDVKAFMSLLFGHSAFDEYSLVSATVQKDYKLVIDGKMLKSWYAEDEECPDVDYKKWTDVKMLIFDFIKGKKTPGLMEIQLIPRQNCFLRIQFEQNELRVITGYFSNEFSLDKTPEHEWDDEVQRLFVQSGIVTERE